MNLGQNESGLREQPILFSAPMVRAILEGRKTQTRRIVKLTLGSGMEMLQHNVELVDFMPGSWAIQGKDDNLIAFRHPYTPGHRLWVRETFALTTGIDDAPLQTPIYRADIPAEGWAEERRVRQTVPGKSPWKPSIFMPRWASRITLEIVSVRLERLAELTEADAIAEGMTTFFDRFPNMAHHQRLTTGELAADAPHRASFAVYWDELHGNGDQVFWKANPWVWVIEFKRLTQTSDGKSAATAATV